MIRINREEMKRHVLFFGHAVSKTREARSMSREQLSRKSGVGLRMLERIETGDASPSGFGLDEICRIAGALKLKPCQLMERYEALIKEPRKSLRRLPWLAVSLGLILSLPGRIHAQGRAQVGAPPAPVQPLGVRPGCWLVSTHASMESAARPQTMDEIRKQYMDKLTPAQRAIYTPAQWDQCRL